MAQRLNIAPDLLLWACRRARREVDELSKAIPHLPEWIAGNARPTLKQLEKFAHTTHAPIGYLFLTTPPVEPIPLPDFRTMPNQRSRSPSADLLDTIYICQQRQEWYRGFARSTGEQPLAFVGSLRVGADVVRAAEAIRTRLGFDLAARKAMPTWTDALKRFIEEADAAGILVMCSGVVMNDTHRALDPEEFRGFAIADALAPLVFVNGADTKAAQMFTLAHELAHLWLGESAVSNPDFSQPSTQRTERWCNDIAAELLVPLAAFKTEYRKDSELGTEANRLARYFKVSTLVILRRMHDAGGLTWAELREAYAQEQTRLQSIQRGSGGNFYLTQTARVSKRFARALAESTWAGRSSFTEAFRLLGIKRVETFREMSERLGVAA